MPLYVVRTTHTPDQCPTANSKVRERVLQGAQQLPQLAQQLGVKIVAGPFVVGSEHEGLSVVEAEHDEAVRQLVQQSGLIQWNAIRISRAQPQEEALKELETMPPPIY